MATFISEAQAELISSLAPDDIPIKLRCAICSKLAVNAFRLPCCEQAICENCQSSLPSSCPVCEHSPLSAEDCNPNKSLRTTIKVFLRTAEKKREALRSKEVKETTPATPVEHTNPVESLAEPSTVKEGIVGEPEAATKAEAQATEATPHPTEHAVSQPAAGVNEADNETGVTQVNEEYAVVPHSESAANDNSEDNAVIDAIEGDGTNDEGDANEQQQPMNGRESVSP